MSLKTFRASIPNRDDADDFWHHVTLPEGVRYVEVADSQLSYIPASMYAVIGRSLSVARMSDATAYPLTVSALYEDGTPPRMHDCPNCHYTHRKELD